MIIPNLLEEILVFIVSVLKVLALIYWKRVITVRSSQVTARA